MELQSIEDLYKKAPILEVIANRLDDSENQADEQNKEGKKKRAERLKTPELPGFKTEFKPKYPDHFRITQILRDGRWEKQPTLAKFGKGTFEKEISNVATTRKPNGLRIDLYAGKRPGSGTEEFTVFLDAEAEGSVKNALGDPDNAFDKKAKELEEKFVELQSKSGTNQSIDTLRAEFNTQLTVFKHTAELDKIRRDHEREVEGLHREIADLQEEVEDLEAANAELDGELSGAAELITAKIKPPPMQTLLSGALENAAVNLFKNRPKILTDIFGLKTEQIQEIFADENKAPIQVGTSNEASFSEAPVQDEYAGYNPKHAEALKNTHIFAKQLPEKEYELLYTILAFCCGDDGKLDKEHARKLLLAIAAITKEEAEAKAAKAEKEKGEALANTENTEVQ